MIDEYRSVWRSANVPIPEPHVAGLLAGVTLHLLRPWRLTERRGLARVAGLALTATHAVVRQEERELERAFDDYRDYRRDVPRYL